MKLKDGLVQGLSDLFVIFHADEIQNFDPTSHLHTEGITPGRPIMIHMEPKSLRSRKSMNFGVSELSWIHITCI
jgi:hypothetical protein